MFEGAGTEGWRSVVSQPGTELGSVQHVAETQFTSICAELQQVLEEEGLRTTCLDLSEETRAVGFSVDDYDLLLSFREAR